MEELDPKKTGRAAAFELWMKAPMPMVTLVKTLDVTRLVRLGRRGLNGEEFKHTRDHLLAHLEGDRAWRHDKDSYEVNKKKKRNREAER